MIRMPELISWLGNASYGVAGTRLRAEIPLIFRPNDISGLQMWLDANDSSTVNANPFGTVESWHNKGDLSGNFDLSGGADIRYGESFVNGLEVVTFTDNAFMVGNFAMNFQDRTIFYVYRRNTDISGGVLTWLTSDTANGIESGVIQSGPSFTYVLAQHPGSVVNLAFTSDIDRKGYALMVDFSVSSTDLSGNYGGINSVEKPLIVSGLVDNYPTTSIPYYLGNYLNGVPLQNNVDMCEILIYDSVITSEQRASVEEYLTFKWGIVDPPPPPPPPFVPSEIAGLTLWFDADNAASLSLSGSDVVSWSNLGSVSTVAASNAGVVTVVTDVGGKNNVQFQPNTDLTFYTELGYNNRTQFVVFKDITQLRLGYDTTLSFIYGDATYGLKSGVNWDSNSDTFQYTLGYPAEAQPNPIGITGDNPLSNATLATFVMDSSDGALCKFYLNNGSNINTSTSGLDEFNTNPIPYYLNYASNAQGQNMCEFLEYNSVLSSSNISTVTSYLSDKWSLGL